MEDELPGKIKNFFWRLAHDSLALRMNLERREMELDTRCVFCNRRGEEGGHLFFGCKSVRPIWQLLGLEQTREELCKTGSAKEAVRLILELDENVRLLLVTLLWHWWLERNRVRDGERRMEPTQLACIVRKNTDEFPTIGRPSSDSGTRIRKRWERPRADVLKINCDGAFRSETSAGSCGFVIRDAAGQVIRIGAGSWSHLMDALHAELLACWLVSGQQGRWG